MALGPRSRGGLVKYGTDLRRRPPHPAPGIRHSPAPLTAQRLQMTEGVAPRSPLLADKEMPAAST